MPSRRQFCTFFAAGPMWPGAVMALPAERRQPVLLAQPASDAVDPAGYLVSEKLDGVRAIWDGHTLRFRSGRVIAAPAWFTAQLPALPLDGELWAGRGQFERLSGTVRQAVPDERAWRAVRYAIFELPAGGSTFAARAARLAELARQHVGPAWQVVEQRVVPDRPALQRWLAAVLRAGGEGLMLHRADAPVLDGRQPALLKLKPLHDAEAEVLAVVPGRGRHQGRMGALRVRTHDGIEFSLGTGFSDAQRDLPPPPGSWVTFTHRGSTAAGVPRFASFLRLHAAD
jgi:DNA ligase 1